MEEINHSKKPKKLSSGLQYGTSDGNFRIMLFFFLPKLSIHPSYQAITILVSWFREYFDRIQRKGMHERPLQACPCSQPLLFVHCLIHTPFFCHLTNGCLFTFYD